VIIATLCDWLFDRLALFTSCWLLLLLLPLLLLLLLLLLCLPAALWLLAAWCLLRPADAAVGAASKL
jgi:hypothetical protein